jgi:hypothetical protein
MDVDPTQTLCAPITWTQDRNPTPIADSFFASRRRRLTTVENNRMTLSVLPENITPRFTHYRGPDNMLSPVRETNMSYNPREIDRDSGMPTPPYYLRTNVDQFAEKDGVEVSPMTMANGMMGDLGFQSAHPSPQRDEEMDTDGGNPLLQLRRASTHDSGIKARRGGMHGIVNFSMGFRPDCEDCQNKVPGHYVHVIKAE